MFTTDKCVFICTQNIRQIFLYVHRGYKTSQSYGDDKGSAKGHADPLTLVIDPFDTRRFLYWHLNIQADAGRNTVFHVWALYWTQRKTLMTNIASSKTCALFSFTCCDPRSHLRSTFLSCGLLSIITSVLVYFVGFVLLLFYSSFSFHFHACLHLCSYPPTPFLCFPTQRTCF